jgi:hypothetical protein
MLNMDRLVAQKYGHNQLAIRDLVYLLEEGHISLNASAIKGYDKCLQMLLERGLTSTTRITGGW